MLVMPAVWTGRSMRRRRILRRVVKKREKFQLVLSCFPRQLGKITTRCTQDIYVLDEQKRVTTKEKKKKMVAFGWRG